MKQIPFGALPAAEQDAVLAILHEAGVEARAICITRLELAATGAADAAALTAVSGRGWSRTYPCAPGWLDAFALDLQAGALAPQPA